MPEQLETEELDGQTPAETTPAAGPDETHHRAGFVSVIGKPNVGKSTLINLYVGHKVAITSDKPQTTRRTLRGILTRPDAQIIFVDTPGIHRPVHALGKFMVRSAVETLDQVDVVLFMVDGARMPSSEDEEIAEILRDRVKAPILLVMNKMDQLKREHVQEVTEAYWALVNYADWMRISATHDENTDKLLNMIIERLPLGPRLFPEDEITDQPMQTLAGELVREQILINTRQEIPHSAAVSIDEWEDRSDRLTYIASSIWVEKASQKGIVIGEGGAMLKKIGQAARKQIEEWLGHQVYLELHVKVREKWRRDERLLSELGYIPEG
ncbi:MAG: GTPase Era [Anaerolineae bacterium]